MTELGAHMQELFNAGRLEEARACAAIWTEREPANITAWQHRSHAEMWCGDVSAAACSCRRVLDLAPENWRSRFNLATVLLAQGQYREAWPLYETRYVAGEERGSAGFVAFPYPASRLWHGEELAGRRLLLVGEQGLGDQIQFIRFAAALQARGAGDVLVQAGPALAGLLRSAAGVARVVEAPGSDDYDVWLPLLSLPLRLGLEAIPPVVLPYLGAPQARVVHWQQQIEAWSNGRKRFGLVWAGNPGNITDARRSLSLAQALEIVNAGRGATAVSLQLGAAGVEGLADQCRRGMLPLLDLLTDFNETAAAIQAMDLVITVDTAVAHLAGALGKPVWVLLPVGADWRWGMVGEATPWYPTARLFRQPAVGDWAAVLAQVCEALRNWQAA